MLFRESASAILQRRDSFVFFKNLYKIAAVVKAAAVSGLCDGKLCRCQQGAGNLDAVVVEVVDGGAVDKCVKKAAEISGGHSGQTRQLFQCDRLHVVLVDIFQHRLEQKGAV